MLDEIAKSKDLPSKKSSARTSPSTRAKRAACRRISGFLYWRPKKTIPKMPLFRYLWTYGESNPDLVHAMDAFYRYTIGPSEGERGCLHTLFPNAGPT